MYPAHLHIRKFNKEYHLILLLIPSVIFSLIISAYIFIVRRNNNSQVAAINNPQVLGEDIKVDNLDK